MPVASKPDIMATPPPPFARATPLSEQQEAFFLQLLELWNRALLFFCWFMKIKVFL